MTDKMCYSWDVMPGRPSTKPTPAFGSRLAALRQERGWTQANLAERLGVTVKMVTYYEREAANPTANTLAKIAAAFGIEPATLMETSQVRRAAKPGPPSQLEQRISALRELPRERQKIVLQVLDTFLRDAQKAS
jgi:transcriptional regulator with XRE-family HTH domain